MSSDDNGKERDRTEEKMTVNEATLITDLDLATLRGLLQQTGYRVETLKEGQVTFLRSATNGLPFDIRPGNALSGEGDRFADAAFVALFAIRGALPLELVNRWNRSRRFARLFIDQPVEGQDFLVFCMDVSVVGGVSARQLLTQVELWDGLIQQLIPWLREELRKIAPTIDATSGAGDSSGQGAVEQAAAPQTNVNEPAPV